MLRTPQRTDHEITSTHRTRRLRSRGKSRGPERRSGTDGSTPLNTADPNSPAFRVNFNTASLVHKHSPTPLWDTYIEHVAVSHGSDSMPLTSIKTSSRSLNADNGPPDLCLRLLAFPKHIHLRSHADRVQCVPAGRSVPAVAHVAADTAYIARCIDAELALAGESAIISTPVPRASLTSPDAQAALDVIPQDAGRQIRAGCSIDKLDFERLRKETDIVGYPILPLIRQLDGMCEGSSGKYLVSLLHSAGLVGIIN